MAITASAASFNPARPQFAPSTISIEAVPDQLDVALRVWCALPHADDERPSVPIEPSDIAALNKRSSS